MLFNYPEKPVKLDSDILTADEGRKGNTQYKGEVSNSGESLFPHRDSAPPRQGRSLPTLRHIPQKMDSLSLKIYLFDLDTCDDTPRPECLDRKERPRWEQMAPALKDKFLLERTILKQLLSRATGISQEFLSLEYNAKGKPYLPNSSLHFNLSHSCNMLAIALSDTEVGVDIEYMKPRPVSRIAESFFQEEQSRNILDSGDSLQNFYSHWVIMESWAKWHGESLLERRSTGFCLLRDKTILLETTPPAPVLPEIGVLSPAKNFLLAIAADFLPTKEIRVSITAASVETLLPLDFLSRTRKKRNQE